MSSWSQNGNCKSVSLGEANVPSCANIFVEFGDITVTKLQGKIESPLENPILIEVFRLEKSERKIPSYRIPDLKDRILAFSSNDEGEFCHPGLPDGYYLLRFGTEEGGMNCSWIKVRIAKNSVDRNIKVQLSIGI